MASRFTIEEIRSRTYKSRDAWWTVLLVDPLASRLVQFAVRFRWITPNRLTVAAFLLGLASAACFAMADYPWLVAGALLFHISFVLDCMDGKIARLLETGTVFGAWLDFVFDRLKVFICAAALMVGQYHHTGEVGYLLVGGAVVFLDMFRYLNGAQIGKVKGAMRAKLAEAEGPDAVRPMFVEELVREHPVGEFAVEEIAPDDTGPVVDLNRNFRSRFRGFVRFRNVLIRHRIRAHLISGIEFEMFVLIVGPVIGLIIPTTLVVGALLLAFESLLVYKMWLATRDFDRHVATLPNVPGQRAPVDEQTLSPSTV